MAQVEFFAQIKVSKAGPPLTSATLARTESWNLIKTNAFVVDTSTMLSADMLVSSLYDPVGFVLIDTEKACKIQLGPKLTNTANDGFCAGFVHHVTSTTVKVGNSTTSTTQNVAVIIAARGTNVS